MAKVEKLLGKGNLYSHGAFISKVRYALEVPTETPDGLNRIRGQIKVLSDDDQFRPIWRYARFTLHLKDKRQLELLCNNFEPATSICDIEAKIILTSDKYSQTTVNRGYKSIVNSRF
jgi:hypothetical protein